MPDYMSRRGTPLWVQIAAGVFVGTILANVVTWAVALWSARAAAQDAAEALQKQAQRAQKATEQERQLADAAAEQRARTAAAQRKQTAELQRHAELQRRQIADEKDRRELAWTRYYRKPAACDEGRGGAWSVDCANDYMRAKAKFAELYDAGKL